MVRRSAVVVVLVVAAFVAAGCGKSSSSGGGGLDQALSFVPKDAPLVFTVQTDPNGDQIKQLDHLLGKFPFSGQIKSQLKQSVAQTGNLDYDKDLKPVLGNDVVFAFENVQDLQGSHPPVLVALKAKNESKAKSLLEKDANKVGSAQGTDIYKEMSETYLALKDGVIVFTDSRPALEAALARHSGSDHMTSAGFGSLSAGVSSDSLARLGLNLQALIASSPKAKNAEQVKFVAALRNYGQTVRAEGDGLTSDFKVTLAGPLQPEDLPIATGSQSPELVQLPGEIGFGLRDPAQSIQFAEATAAATNPKGYAKFNKQKNKLSKQLGVDVDKDLIQQFTGDAVVSVSLDGKIGLRAKLQNPAAFQATLEKVAPKLPQIDPKKHLAVSTPKGGKGFYAIASPDGKSYAFGVIGGNFVLASDAARAAQIARQPTSSVSGAKGALTIAFDTRSVANLLLQKRGQGAAGALVTGALGDFTGSVDAEPTQITGQFKQAVK